MTVSTETILVIDEIGFPLGSARGITQTLEPIGASSSMRRSINGELIDISGGQFRKYQSAIACTDQRPPALDNIWPGKTIVVDCIAELWFRTSTDGPARTVVSGSEHEEGAFTYYRPQLIMKIMAIKPTFNEWGAEVGWQIELEEV